MAIQKKRPAKKVLGKKAAPAKKKKVVTKKIVLPAEKKVTDRKDFFNYLFVAFSLIIVTLFVALILLLREQNYWQAVDEQINQTVSQEELKMSERNEMGDPLITEVGDKLDAPIWSRLDPALGTPKAGVKIFYFSDFNSALCRQQENILRKLAFQHAGEIFLVRKDYPMRTMTSLSWQAAKAGRCAASQGDFWTFHDFLLARLNGLKQAVSDDLVNQKLVSSQKELIDNRDILLSVAENAGLKIEEFAKCLTDDDADREVQRNLIEARDLGIATAPLLFINGQEFSGLISYEDLERLSGLATSSSVVDTGLTDQATSSETINVIQ